MPRRSAERHLVGADVEAAIDGGRIAVDDLAAVPLGERQRQRALARRGRPENRDDEPASSAPTRDEHVDDEGDQEDQETELLRMRVTAGGASL